MSKEKVNQKEEQVVPRRNRLMTVRPEGPARRRIRLNDAGSLRRNRRTMRVDSSKRSCVSCEDVV